MNASSSDDALLKLVLTAQLHPVGSLPRRRNLGKLFRILRAPGMLVKPMRGRFEGFYNDIYEEALQRLFTYLSGSIESYNPARGTVLQWINFLLNKRFFTEASREFLPTVYRGMDARSIQKVTLEDLDRKIVPDAQAQLNPSLSDDVKAYIDADPDGVFEVTHVEGYPDANFKRIALMRLEGYSWRELSEYFSVPSSSLSSLHGRSIKKFASRIREDLS